MVVNNRGVAAKRPLHAICRKPDHANRKGRLAPDVFANHAIEALMGELTEAAHCEMDDLKPAPIEPSWIIEGNPEARSRLLSTTHARLPGP
jgi:hypothetical protein